MRAWRFNPSAVALAGVMLLAVGGGSALPGGIARAAAPVVNSQPLFAASFKDFDRKQQPLSQFKGKPMLVYFWATWCKSCKHEVPELIALHNKYGSKLNVIGIAIDNTDKVLEFARQNKINYTLLLGSNDAIALSKQLGNSVGGLPFAVVIDAKGNIVQTLLGETPPGKFEELVRPLLS